MSKDSEALYEGSSPRMRGTLASYSQLVNPQRIIPAYAGNTLKCATMYTWVRDHPRVCGEHATRHRKRWFSWRDHPRVCGEHRSAANMPDCTGGSSPRMRGTPIRPAAMHRVPGIIPAYAGNTCRRDQSRTMGRDHPRVCGEHHDVLCNCPFSPGSSPRMRGTLAVRQWLAITQGIIPAYAGNTTRHRKSRHSWKDHPRVCGEHLEYRTVRRPREGSSPRMRGTH